MTIEVFLLFPRVLCFQRRRIVNPAQKFNMMPELMAKNATQDAKASFVRHTRLFQALADL